MWGANGKAMKEHKILKCNILESSKTLLNWPYVSFYNLIFKTESKSRHNEGSLSAYFYIFNTSYLKRSDTYSSTLIHIITY